MSSNSKREQILLAVVNRLSTLSSIKTVKRVKLSFADLSTIATTQLPLVAVVGQLPKPVAKRSSRTTGVVDKFVSELGVELFCYALDNVDPDSLVSDLADDIWALLYGDPTLGNLCTGIDVVPEVRVGYWDPYIAFKMTCTVTYIHDSGGI